jgi:hypothetical protein
MKKTIIWVSLFIILFSVGLQAKPKPKKSPVIPGTYSTAEGDFYTKFWKEMFKGGGPGQTGNELMALGEGFIFNQAKLQSVVASDNPNYTYKTTYVRGKLTLNSSGPWLKSGKLRASNITVTNYSSQNPPLTGILTFYLRFEGDFDNEPYHFVIEATYEGQPEVKYGEEGKPVFQRGMDFEVTITITQNSN